MINRCTTVTDQLETGEITGNGVGNAIGKFNILGAKEEILSLH